MTQLSPDLAKTAVQAFLDSQFNKKTETDQKQLAKAKEEGDHEKISKIQRTLTTAKEKYHASQWLENAANKMAKQLYFGTHISKGVHPDAKGDNISFQSQINQSPTLVGTHSIKSHLIDANGNAAALPLAAFFEFEVYEKVKISDLILTDNKDFIASLSTDTKVAESYHQAFKSALQNTITEPVTHERNKQMLWVVEQETATVDELAYHNIVPLYPSVFTHEMYQRINQLKFSDENKNARENRFKKTAEQAPYVSLSELATVQLGGTKPQNVSLLMSRQGGRNYLLPSMPPIMKRSYRFNLSKFANSIFGKNLAYYCRHDIKHVASVIESKRNNLEIRNARKSAIDNMLHTLFSIAADIQSNQPAGWSTDYDLHYSQKLWLDPQRSELENEAAFAQERETTDWHLEIMQQFASWFNSLIKAQLPDIKHDVGDSEHSEWQREIEEMSKQYQRAGKGVFL